MLPDLNQLLALKTPSAGSAKVGEPVAPASLSATTIDSARLLALKVPASGCAKVSIEPPAPGTERVSD